jgi:hypothetical protein
MSSIRHRPSGSGARTRVRPAGFDARPERLSSLRAQAQRVFHAASAPDDAPRVPEPDPVADMRDARASSLSAPAVDEAERERARTGDVSDEAPVRSGPQPTELTQQVRALYEDSIVPVSEIARRVGIHERTLYKYVTRGGWRRRYRVKGAASAGVGRAGVRKLDADGAGACDRNTLGNDNNTPNADTPNTTHDGGARSTAPSRSLPSRRRSAPRVSAKGAGGRYIRAEDAGKPHRSGLKALDPQGEARALARCRSAALLSEQAVSRTQRLRDMIADVRTLAILVGVVRDLVALEESLALEGKKASARVFGNANAKARPRTAQAGEHGLEEQRRALARKLDAWVRTQEDLARSEGA